MKLKMSPRKIRTAVLLLLTAICIKEGTATVEPLEYLPEELQWYLDTCRTTGDLTQQNARLVFWTSINQYISKFAENRPGLTQGQEAYLKHGLDDAFMMLIPNVSYHHRVGRAKRQAPAARVRQEIRAMSRNERRRYFAAINAMKRDRSLPPNVYDYLAAYHSVDNVRSAHFGPAFPSWHRLYLWIFEYFLRLQDPTVTIPYWASVLDNDMQDPTQSVIWSPGFYGNGDGEIRTGPFRNWAQINPETSFTRNVQGGPLYTYEGINRILNQTRNEDILIPTARPQSNFETQHAAAHIFVGGSMNNLNSAARDPIFFSHHSFVDQIWERFRMNQINNNINPQTDFPFIDQNPRFRPEHRPTANAGFAGLSENTGFPNFGVAETWTQNLGYLNVFSNLVIYEEVPECPFCANSPYLFCDRSLSPERCVSRTIADMRGRSNVAITNDLARGRGRRHAITFSQESVTNICHRKTFMNNVENKWSGQFKILPGLSKKWVYIPVKIVSKRPAEYREFDQYSLYNNRPSMHFGIKNEFLREGFQKPYDCCNKHQNAVGKITIVAYGLNFDAYSEENVLVDNRLGIAEASGFIPVMMPVGASSSEVVIAAFDSCGRVCKPYSKLTGTRIADSPFTGGIRVSYSQPKQFAESYGDAMLDIWDIPSKSSCPTLNYNRIPVSFFCEYTDTWIWESEMTNSEHTLQINQQPYSWFETKAHHKTGFAWKTGAKPTADTIKFIITF